MVGFALGCRRRHESTIQSCKSLHFPPKHAPVRRHNAVFSFVVVFVRICCRAMFSSWFVQCAKEFVCCLLRGSRVKVIKCFGGCKLDVGGVFVSVSSCCGHKLQFHVDGLLCFLFHEFYDFWVNCGRS